MVSKCMMMFLRRSVGDVRGQTADFGCILRLRPSPHASAKTSVYRPKLVESPSPAVIEYVQAPQARGVEQLVGWTVARHPICQPPPSEGSLFPTTCSDVQQPAVVAAICICLQEVVCILPFLLLSIDCSSVFLANARVTLQRLHLDRLAQVLKPKTPQISHWNKQGLCMYGLHQLNLAVSNFSSYIRWNVCRGPHQITWLERAEGERTRP